MGKNAMDGNWVSKWCRGMRNVRSTHHPTHPHYRLHTLLRISWWINASLSPAVDLTRRNFLYSFPTWRSCQFVSQRKSVNMFLKNSWKLIFRVMVESIKSANIWVAINSIVRIPKRSISEPLWRVSRNVQVQQSLNDNQSIISGIIWIS